MLNYAFASKDVETDLVSERPTKDSISQIYSIGKEKSIWGEYTTSMPWK